MAHLTTDRPSNVTKSRNRIIMCIAKHEPEGIFEKEIAKHTELSSRTVIRLCKTLSEEKYIWKKNKLEKYHLGPRLYDDMNVQAFLFHNEATRQLRKLNLFSNNSKVFNHSVLKLLQDKTDNIMDKDELELLEFTSKVGALIVYIMIQAMSPYIVHETFAKEKITLKGKEKEERIAKRWLKSLDLGLLFHEFSKLDVVRRGRAIHNLIFEGLEDEETEHPSYMTAKNPGLFNKSIKLSKENNSRDPTNDLPIQPKVKERSIMDKDFEKTVNDWIEEKAPYHPLSYEPQNPKWSSYEMLEPFFYNINQKFQNLYPNLHQNFEKIKEKSGQEVVRIRAEKRNRQSNKNKEKV